MIKVFGIFPIKIVKQDFPGEGLMDIVVIEGIKVGARFGVFYDTNLKFAAIVLDPKDLILISGIKQLTKEQLAKEKVCSDFDINILEKRLS